jgi:hypothetical protein
MGSAMHATDACAADSVITAFRQWYHAGIRTGDGVKATLFRVTFQNNVAYNAELSGISSNSYGPAIGQISELAPASQIWMYDCTFMGSQADVDADASSDNERNALYSNTPEPRIWVHSKGGEIVDPRIPTRDRFTDGVFEFFPTEKDSAFQSIVQVRLPSSCVFRGCSRRFLKPPRH